MIGVYVLILLVIVAIATAIIGLARAAGASARLRRATARVRAALDAGSPEEVGGHMREIARGVTGASAADASATVLACRQTFSRDVVPVLVAALGHSDPAVSADAALALNDLGAPGLRGVWQAVEGGAPAPALAEFLLNHSDWLFERLMETFVERGEAGARQHESLWRNEAMQSRLGLLRGSDAINRLRADHIAAALHLDDGRVA